VQGELPATPVAFPRAVVAADLLGWTKQVGTMDRAVLEANSNVIRGFVEVSPSGIPVPTLYFDAAKRKIIGFTVVDPENFKKMSSEELRHELMTVVLRTWFESSLTFEELKNPKDADFAFEFRGPS